MAQPKVILEKYLEKISQKHGIEKSKMEVTEITSGGANFTSAIFNIEVTVSGVERDLRLFAKVATVPNSVRGQFNFDISYKIEKYFYDNIVPVYEEMQVKCRIPDEERIKFPKCYGCNPTRMEETVVMEDLVANGHQPHDRLLPIDLEYALKAVEEIAKLHALSFVFKEERPEAYHKCFSLFDSVTTYWKYMKGPFQSTMTQVLEVVPEELRQRLQKFIEDSLTDEGFEKYYGAGPWGALVHGDFRASNILHKRGQDGQVVSLVPVDYQNLHWGSPSSDLLYLLYNGTDAEFRRLHLTHVLDHYYTSFSKYLQQMNKDPEEVFSRNDFDEDFRNMLPYGLFTAIFILPIVLVDAEAAPVVNGEDQDVLEFAVKPNELYVERFLPILNEFVEAGIL